MKAVVETHAKRVRKFGKGKSKDGKETVSELRDISWTYGFVIASTRVKRPEDEDDVVPEDDLAGTTTMGVLGEGFVDEPEAESIIPGESFSTII